MKLTYTGGEERGSLGKSISGLERVLSRYLRTLVKGLFCYLCLVPEPSHFYNQFGLRCTILPNMYQMVCLLYICVDGVYRVSVVTSHFNPITS